MRFFHLPRAPTASPFGAFQLDESRAQTAAGAQTLKLLPQPLTKDREATATFFEHHNLIENQRSKPLGLLIVGIKKDVVLTNRLQEKPHRVAIY